MADLTMGQKIKALREENNLTLEQVGNAVGVGKSTVRKWENGIIANMRRDKIADLAKVLHTTPAYLMGLKKKLNWITYLELRSESSHYLGTLLVEPPSLPTKKRNCMWKLVQTFMLISA